MRNSMILSGAVAIFLSVAGLFYFLRSEKTDTGFATKIYYCPMHPDYTSPKPGECPICHMNLVKAEKSNMKSVKGKVKFYRNPMNPDITSTTPMKDEMGMDYIPVYEDEENSSHKQGIVTITTKKQQLIGLKTVKATYKPLSITIRASGRVAYDPELYRAIVEYKEAMAAYDKIKESSWLDAATRVKSIADSARIRLYQMGFSDDHIEKAKKDPKYYENLLLPEDKVWVYAQIYEYETSFIKTGQKVIITSASYPEKKFYGVIRSVDPILSADTRTLRARIETENPDRKLRAEMYVEAEIKSDISSALTVPIDAVMKTGSRELVFVMKDETSFEPREVKTGRANDEYIEIISGLKAGETVITSANFLVDSESRMKAAFRN